MNFTQSATDLDFDVTAIVQRTRIAPTARFHRFKFEPALSVCMAGGGVPSLASMAACAVLNSDEEHTKERRRQSDPRAARLGITRRRKRKRDGGLKELVYAEWHQQATRETGLRPDIALEDPRLIDLTEDDSYDWLEDVDYVTVVQDE